jgi:hypothetical protein
MAARDVSSWLPNLLGSTVKVSGAEITTRRAFINFEGATQEDDPDNDATIITIGGEGGGTSGAIDPHDDEYGAVGDGTTDDTAALIAAAAAAAGGCLQLRAGKTYAVSDTIPLPAGTRLAGQGTGTVIDAGALNAPIILVEDATGASVDSITIRGTWGAGANQSAISVADGVGFVAYNVHAEEMGGKSFHVTASAGNFQGHLFVGCSARLALSGGTGFYISGQYTKLIGCEAYGCAVGLVMNAGNIVAVGCNFSASNNKGVHVTSNANGAFNDAHCVLDGCNINHTDTGFDALYVEDIVNGLVVTGCHIYYGDIYLEGSNGVRFVGCQIDVDHIYFDGSQGTSFDVNTFALSNSNTLHNNYNGNASTTTWHRNIDMTGAPYPSQLAVDSGTVYAGGGANYRAQLGPLVGAPTNYSALYLLPPATAAGLTNCSVYSDGTHTYVNSPNTSGLGNIGFYAASSARLLELNPISNLATIDLKTKFGKAAIGTDVAMVSTTVDWSLGNVFRKTLEAGVNAITFSNLSDGQEIVVILTGSGSTVTWPPGTVQWAGGVAPTQTSSGTDVYRFVRANGVVYGRVDQNYS